MSLHKCPECGNETATDSTVAGAFNLPPTLHCVHDEENRVVEMKLVEVKTE